MIQNENYPIQVKSGSVISVLGFPGSGKSTFAGRLLGGWKDQDQKVYASIDESLIRVVQRMRRILTESQQTDMRVIGEYRNDEMILECCRNDTKHLVIDGASIAPIAPIGSFFVYDPHDFVKRLDLQTLVVVFQPLNTKLAHVELDPILHESDVVIRCGSEKKAWDADLGYWIMEKNRYGTQSRGPIR